MKVFSPFLNGNTTTSGSFNVPNHPSTASIQNPLTGSLFHDDTDGILKVYTGTQWKVVGEQTTPTTGATIEYLLVAGGGGGGGRHAGGGGAGGYLSSSLASVQSGSSFSITVGSGGSGGPDGSTVGKKQGTSGTNSTITGTTITTITAIAGGGGGGDADDSDPLDGLEGLDGGSGGGASYLESGGSGTTGQGFAGGDGQGSPNYSGGGGGGASAVGVNASGTNAGGGGSGLSSTITGTSVTRAGGGGAGGWNGVGSGAGGNGGGGTGIGNAGSSNAGAGTVNTGGGGGGGGGNSSAGGSGGSGVAIFAYNTGSLNCAGGIVGDVGNGRKYHQFNASDTIKVGSTTDFQIITESLSAHFDAAHFSSRGTSTWSDLEGNGNGTISGATLNTYDYTFDGSNDVVSISGEKITSDNMSIEVWLTIDNPSESGTYREIISQQANSNRGIFWGKTSTANQLRFLGTVYNFSSINASTFTHLVVTRNSSGDVVFYENGSQGGTGSGNTFATSQGVYNNTGTRIGRQYGNYTEYWDGKIAQVRFYNKTLSASEVLQNYNATKTNFV